MNVYPEAYLDYLVHFHGDRDYFECHEILEEYWKEHPTDVYHQTWVGFIQVAVSLYHHRRGNVLGARKMMHSAITNLNPQHMTQLGIDTEAFLHELRERLHQLDNPAEPPYLDLNIPLADSELLATCKARCTQLQRVWGNPSPMDEELIHRHTLRDRSDVIRLRQLEKERKAKERERERGSLR